MSANIVLVDVATKDLKGAALDWVVAYLEGVQVAIVLGGLIFGVGGGCPCRYSSDWSQGGPLRDKYHVALYDVEKGMVAATLREDPEHWIDESEYDAGATGATALVAMCRAIVAAKLGDIVKVPALLVLP